MLEKAPIIFMIPQIIFCEVLIFGDDTQEAMFTYAQTVMSQGKFITHFLSKILPHMSWRKKYLSALEGKKNLKILSRLLSLHVIKASWFEPREKCSVKYKLTSSNENDIIVSAIASMDLPINSNLGHPASEVQKHTSM